MTAPVVVVGDALLDVRAAPEADPRRGADVPARIAIAPGGQGANVAVRLARRGVPVELVTGLADDMAGRLLHAALDAEGVTVRAVAVPATGSVVVIRDAGGERTMLSQRAPFAHALDPGAVSTPGWLVLSGYLLLEVEARRLARQAADAAARRVVLGCAVGDELVAAWRAAAADARADLLVLNRDEAARLAPAPDANVAVTDPGGATIRVGGTTVTASAAAVPVVDTTGAGDAFAAALIAALRLAPWPPAASVLRAAAAEAVALAGLVAGADGAQSHVASERPATLRT